LCRVAQPGTHCEAFASTRLVREPRRPDDGGVSSGKINPPAQCAQNVANWLERKCLAKSKMEKTMRNLLRDLKRDNKGVTMIEYALIAGLVSVVAIALLTGMGSSLVNLFTTVNGSLSTA
jgi:pilus assembly protein Flp/PilA